MVEFMEVIQVPVQLVLVDVQLGGALVVWEEVAGQVVVEGLAGALVVEVDVDAHKSLGLSVSSSHLTLSLLFINKT
jgi:hypothetical protein